MCRWALVPFLVFTMGVGLTHVAIAQDDVRGCHNEGECGECITDSGQPGERCCWGGRLTPCQPTEPPPPPPPPPIQGSAIIKPKYFVLTVVYAPPGTKGPLISSSVRYANGSTTGTTTSSSSSFKGGFSVSFSETTGFIGSTASVGGYYSYKQSATDSSQVKIEKSRANTILGTGPSVDGINHDYDRIFLWLSPTIDLTVEGDSINWKFLDGETAEITYIYAGYLNGHMEIPIGVWDIFRRHNISEQDFPDILSHDPLSTETSALDSARFEPINTSFPYIPPPRPTDPPQQMEYSIRDDLASSSGTSTIQEHSVGASVGYTLNAYVVKAALKVDQSWTWSNISSSAGSAGTTQYASMTIGSPAFGYTGPVSVQAFYDTHFKTFAFDFIRDKPLALTGTVSAAGRPVPSKEVLLTAGDGVQYRTYTDQAGDYRFFGSYNVPVTVRSDNIAKSVARVGENARIDFSQPQ